MSKTLEMLLQKFNGALVVPASEVATVVHNWTMNSIRNRIHRDNFPIATFKDGKHRQVCLIDVANWIDQARGANPESEVQTELTVASAGKIKRGRGRPKKVAELSRDALPRSSQ